MVFNSAEFFKDTEIARALSAARTDDKYLIIRGKQKKLEADRIKRQDKESRLGLCVFLFFCIVFVVFGYFDFVYLKTQSHLSSPPYLNSTNTRNWSAGPNRVN